MVITPFLSLAYNMIMLNIVKINLNQLRKNTLEIKSKLNLSTRLCAVVKADAYGHGAPAVANAIYDIVDCFAVALLEEALELRNSGIDKDILVLTPIFDEDLERAVHYNLTLTVESKTQIEKIDREGKRQRKKTKLHLKFNVGMNRFGVDSLAELDELLKLVTTKKQVILDGMYSHLPCPQNKKLLKTAENKFLLANNLVKGYNNKAICHLSASGGFLMGVQFDMVRIGILLYGYKPFPSNLVKLAPVMKVYSRVVRRRSLKKNQTALYGEYYLNKDQSVSLIRYGYADGLERLAVHGQVNNRCMDATMISGDFDKTVLVMDNALELAKKYKTIPYEILCKIGLRGEKIYIR